MDQQKSIRHNPKGNKGHWQLKTLKSYALLLVSVLVAVILGLNIFAFIQNTRQLESSKGVSEIRMPLSLRAQDILIGLNKTSAMQRGFLLTGNQQINGQRQDVWADDIWPALEVLKKVKPALNVKENVLRIEQLEELLPRYEALQEEIDAKTQSLALDNDIDLSAGTDSLALQNFTVLRQRLANQQQVIDMISLKVVPLRREIGQVLDPLIFTQEEILEANVQEVVQGIDTTRSIFIILSVVGITAAAILAFFFLKKLNTSIGKPKGLLEQLAQGVLVDKVEETQDELNDVILAGNRLNKNLAAASAFAKSIGEGDFKSDFKPASEGDTLGNALVHMRNRLLEVSEEDKRRSWTTSGLAQIGEILRREQQENQQLYIDIIQFVVKYLGANQGGLFLVNEEDESNPCLELAACYAYERQKFLQKTILPGEGLVGQAYVEQEPIFLTEVPGDYVQITSGLGDANPGCILITPLKVNEEVSGIIEIASFKKLEAFELEFVNKLSETIASVISSVKVAQRTNLLLEETQQQAEEMRAQEEEMRQNNEELQATQEEMERKSMEASEQFSKLNAVLESTVDAIITIDERGTVDSINKAGLNLFGYTKEEVIGQNVKMLTPDAHRKNHDQYLENYHKTGTRKVIGIPREEKGRRKDGSEFDLSLAVNEAFVGERRIFTGILRDISEQKKMERDLKEQMEQISSKEESLRQNLEEMTAIQEELESQSQEAASQHAKMKAILDSTIDAILTIDEKGTIETINPACEKLFGYTSDELIGQNVKMLTPDAHRKNHDQYLKNYRETGARKVIGLPREEKGRRKDGTEFPLALAVNEARFGDRRIFTGILRDITQQKEMEMELQQQLEEARATEEEIRQNMEELTAIQESLEAKNREMEEVRKQEKERADQQIAARNEMMEKAAQKFKKREKELLAQLAQQGK